MGTEPRSWNERRRLAARAVFAILIASASAPLPAVSAPPPPPGGHIPTAYGGNNGAGYPPLQQTVSAPLPSGRPSAAFRVACVPNPFAAGTQFRFVAGAG